jgi:signal transduction histidine kinase
MKIQTQFHLLIGGILLAPMLIFLLQILDYNTLEKNEQINLPSYIDVVALIDGHMSSRDWEILTGYVSHLRRYKDVTIFRDDFLVLYSNISDFRTGVFETPEKVLAMLTMENKQYDYNFVAPNGLDGYGYVFFRRPAQLSGYIDFKARYRPLLISSIFIFVLVVFAVCMSLFIARSITKSIVVLEDSTRRIAGGDLDMWVDARGSYEITSLTNSFNKMRNILKEEEQRRYRFIMGITHDLKTPLALIKGYTEAIEDGISEVPGSCINATEIIAVKADQLESMINDLIDFVRMDTGEWRGRLKNVNITTFLQDYVKTTAPDVELFRKRMVTDIALPENLCVPLDERLVRRALENIVNNAIRYTPDDAVIRLEAVMVGHTIRLSIRDNGPGIAAADLPHIFDIFYRGSSSRREQGMGLGLSVVKWVVDSHGWTIAADTKQEGERGTCFTIVIPLAG